MWVYTIHFEGRSCCDECFFFFWQISRGWVVLALRMGGTWCPICLFSVCGLSNCFEWQIINCHLLCTIWFKHTDPVNECHRHLTILLKQLLFFINAKRRLKRVDVAWLKTLKSYFCGHLNTIFQHKQIKKPYYVTMKDV